MMAHPTSFEGGSFQASLPPVDFSQPLINTNLLNEEEDEDQWEYEYSTTETEIFYVTLDLHTADLPTRHKPESDDAPRRPRWTNPSYGTHGRGKGGVIKVKAAPTFSVADNHPPQFSGQRALLPAGRGVGDPAPGLTPAPGPSPSPAPVATPGLGNNIRPGETAGPSSDTGNQDSTVKGDINLATTRASKVQIIDLHTDNPLVSYGGHFFSCQWASNIGTEMLFTVRDTNCTLPILQELPDQVDLLAASSARIISKHVELKPRAQFLKRKRARFEDDYEEEDDGHFANKKLLVKIGPNVSVARQEQAKFLSQMIQIKQDKGEEDMVTVNVKKRLTTEKWRIEYWRVRKEERAQLEQILKKKKATEEEITAAKARLQQMDEEEAVETIPDPDTLGPVPDRGRGSRGGTSHLKSAKAKKKGPGARIPGRPSKHEPRDFDRRPSETSISTPGAFSDGHSYGTPAVFDDAMDGTPNEFGTPMALDDDENLEMQNEGFEGYEGLEGADGFGVDLDYDEESPSHQFLDDMELHDEDAEGDEDDEG